MSSLEPNLILAKELKRKQKVNPSYSIRAFARDLKVSSSYLSAVLNGKKPIPANRLNAIAKRLEMDEVSINHLKRAMALKSVSKTDLSLLSHPEKKHPLDKLSETKVMSKTDLELWSKWYYLPILDLSTCSDFKPDIKWIARKLKIPLGDAVEATEFLLRRGFLIEENGVWKKTDQHLRFPCVAPNETIRNFHKEYMLKAIQVMKEQTSPEEFTRRMISGMIIASNPEKIAQARQILEVALIEASRVLSEGDCTELYQLGVQLFPLTQK